MRKRPDLKIHHHRTLFTKWLTGNRSLSEISNDHGVIRQTLVRQFATLWERVRQPPALDPESHATYILDGVYLSGRENAALIYRAMTAQMSWMRAVRESFASWLTFLARRLPHGVQLR